LSSNAFPLATGQQITTTAIATTGAVSDSFVDYVINWNPVVVNFGSGESFRINLNNLSFANNNEGLKTQTATVTLLSGVALQTIPEPGMLALLGLGLLGLGLAA